MEKKKLTVRLSSGPAAVYREIRAIGEELDSIMERDPAAISRTEVALL